MKDKKNTVFNVIAAFTFIVLLIGWLVSESQPEVHAVFKQLLSLFMLIMFTYVIFENKTN